MKKLGIAITKRATGGEPADMSDAAPPSQGPAALPLGYSMLPRGQIATLVTYLEMSQRPATRDDGASASRSLDKPYELHGPLAADLAAYRSIFRRVGEDWLWFSRLVMSDEELRAIIGDPQVAVYVPHHEGRPAGLLELDFRAPGECELAFFGLVKEVIGKGLGRRLMHDAIGLAFAKPIRRSSSTLAPSIIRAPSNSTGDRAFARTRSASKCSKTLVSAVPCHVMRRLT